MTTDVILVAGARPNFVKIKPVLDALHENQLASILVDTGQHYDERMNRVFFDELGIRAPDYSLGVGSGSHADQTARVMIGFEQIIQREIPRAVVVVGDVNSTVACALVGAKHGSYVVHVEAGLRSRDWSMPEEINRVVTDRVSDLLLAPSHDAVENLLKEGVDPSRISLVGNVMIDTLFLNLEQARLRTISQSLGLSRGSFVLATLHRPSNVDEPSSLQNILSALSEISRHVPVIFPVHPRTRARLVELQVPAGIRLLEPLSYLDFLSLQSEAGAVITDSGGVQEETTALGIPCITARTSTERPITVLQGTNRLVGTNSRNIITATLEALRNPPLPRRPELWDGCAGHRCGVAIQHLLESNYWPRPSHETHSTSHESSLVS